MARAINGITATQADRFWEKVTVAGAGCWEWTGARIAAGYGLFSANGYTYLAHRISWFLSHDHDPGDLLVRHKCNNPACVRPDHLVPGTASDNALDACRAGRAMTPDHRKKMADSRPRGDKHYLRRDPARALHGEQHGRALVTEEQAKEMRLRYAEGGITQAQLGLDYGLTGCAVGRIVRGNSWKRDFGTPSVPKQRNHAQGKKVKSCKLSEEDVRTIRARYAAGGVTYPTLAREYGVAANTIRKIILRHTWSHVP